MTSNEVQEQIIEEFSEFEEWMDKYEYLIELGKGLPIIEPKYKIKENLIQGCQSKVWLHADYEEGVVKFSADSDAIITKGIIALLIRVLNNRKPEDLMNIDLYFIDKIGLSANLSPTRANGLLAMVKQLKLYGMAYHAKNTSTTLSNQKQNN